MNTRNKKTKRTPSPAFAKDRVYGLHILPIEPAKRSYAILNLQWIEIKDLNCLSLMKKK